MPGAVTRALVLPALALLAGCGALSRPLLAERQRMSVGADAAALQRLCGSEPLLASAWLGAARTQSSPEAALAIVERGLSFLPDQPDLIWVRVSLLAHQGRRDEQIAAAQAALSRDVPAGLAVELRQFLVDGRLAKDDPEAAAAEVRRLGGVSNVPADVVAAAWAAVAVSFEFLGRAVDADAAMDASLDLGPRGVTTLREITALAPEREAACRLLAERAAARHSGHADLEQFLVVDRMLARDLPGAEARLAAMTQPLPLRLLPSTEALRARLDILQGRVAEGLALLRARLDGSPGDPAALAVLVECRELHGVPDDAELLARLRAAAGLVTDPGLARQLDTVRQQLEAQPAPAAEPRAEGAPEPGSTPGP